MGKFDIGPFLMLAGSLLLVFGIAGWFVSSDPTDAYATDLASNLLYTLLGPILILAGYTWSPNIRHDVATAAGVFFILLGIAGLFVSGRETASNLWVTDLGTIENIGHLLLGAVMVLGGFHVLTEEVYVVPRRYRWLMNTRAVRK